MKFNLLLIVGLTFVTTSLAAQTVILPSGQNVSAAVREIVQGFTLRPTGADGKPMEHHFERLPSALVPDVAAAYAEDLSTGNELRLLKFQRKTILAGQRDATYTSSAPADTYQSSTQYYLRWSDGTYIPVKANKVSILAAIALRQPSSVATELQDKTKTKSDAELGELVQRIDKGLATK